MKRPHSVPNAWTTQEPARARNATAAAYTAQTNRIAAIGGLLRCRLSEHRLVRR